MKSEYSTKLYGQKCHTPLCWEEVGDVIVYILSWSYVLEII
jgi:hypothetical protein